MQNLPIKKKSKSESFSATSDAQKSENINNKCVWGWLDDTIQSAPDNTPGIAPKDALIDLYKDAQKGACEVELKGALLVSFDLHLFMYLSVHKNNSIKCEIKGAMYVALEGASKISF